MSLKILTGILVIIATVNSESLPSYIKTCSRSLSSKDFSKCATENGKLAIPSILKGDKKFNVLPLVPFKVDKIAFRASDLDIKANDLDVFGLDTVDLRQILADFNIKKFKALLHFEYLTITGNYEVNGRLLVPLQGRGPLNITLYDVNAQYGFDYDLIKKDGQDYLNLKDDNFKLRSKRQFYKLDNLFGNPRISEEINRTLNENSAEVGSSLREPVFEIIKMRVTSILKNYMSTASFAEVFPEK